ncbi:MAG: geranylgeranylglycerol-phosphate geranylgeranyltransferase [Rhodothermales bacterium]
MLPTVAAAFRLVRPLNITIILAGVAAGVILSNGSVVLPAEILAAGGLAAAAAVLVAAGGNALNDVVDLQIDAVHKADRPLPSGRISIRAARLVWMLTTLAGVLLGAIVSGLHLGLAILAAVLLYVYSTKLKGRPFLGNATVAFVVGLALLYGGLVAASPEHAVVGAVFAFLTTFSREVIKDVEDMEADASAGLRTAPVVYGVAVARYVSVGGVLLTVLLTPIPFLWMDYGPLFLLLVLLADLLLLRCVWISPDRPEDAAAASAWLKWGMVVGIAALIAA